jgi:hypothetical protein
MKHSQSFTLALALSALSLSTGCVGTGPNTQQGAVAGGAAGALAGAIIGNNSRGHDAGGGALVGGIIGAIAGGTIGNSLDQQRGTLYHTEAEARTKVVMAQPPPMPPPPQADIITERPAPNAMWVRGYWAYTGEGRRYVWVAGHWEIPAPQYQTYVQPHWARQGDTYVYVQGYWR